MCRNLNKGSRCGALSDWTVPGIVSHVAGPTPNGDSLVVDVWASEEAFKRFGQQLMPRSRKPASPTCRPRVFPVRNAVTG